MSSYNDLRYQRGDQQRRKVEGPRHGKKGGRNFDLKPDSPAVVENRTQYPHMLGEHSYPPLKSGFNNSKIGKTITKGRWKGMPIYTLTLEERATCGPCNHKLDCYGNKMVYAARQPQGDDTIAYLQLNLWELQQKHAGGFVVRLHVLGDFYSVEYVRHWLAWLEKFPALRIYGYTARDPMLSIGVEIMKLQNGFEDRFRMRWSDYPTDHDATRSIKDEASAGDDVIVCPAQVSKTACCATCALCWETRKNIAFISH